MRTRVIVPAHNSRETLPRTLEALAEQELDGEYEVIVIDDGSSDGTADVARSAPGPVAVASQSHSGPAAARNLGVARSSGSLLAFCDADVFPTARWLHAGIDALKRADIVQGKVLPDPSVRLGPFDRSIWVTARGGLWESANLFVRRELFERVGGFSDWLAPRKGKQLGEDVFFAYKALRAGARPDFCQRALAYHAVYARDWITYVLERRRLSHFPAATRRVPELRRDFLYQRLFLNARSARFDLALLGAAGAAWRHSPLPLWLALPYLQTARAGSLRAPRSEPGWRRVAAADLAADLVGLVALVEGSLRHRSPVI